MSLKTWMDWLELFLPYLGNPFCFWFSPSRQLSHMKTSFQLRRRRPQSIILIFSLWSTAPPSSARRMGTTAPVLWSLFAQNRRQLSAIIVRKLPAQICNYWPLIVIKFTTNAQRLTPFDKKNWLRWAFTSGTCPEVLNAICFMLRKLQDRYMSTPRKPFSGTIFNLSSCL